MSKEEILLEKIILDDFGIDKDDFYNRSGSRISRDARKFYALIAYKVLRLPQKQIADRLTLEQAAVSKMAKSACDIIAIYPAYKNRLARILKRMGVKIEDVTLAE